MMDWLREAPFGWAYLFLFCGAMVRANTTYWIGRGIAAGVSHSRFEHVLQGPIYQRARRFMARWGILAVPLSFLTVGIQTAVNASAGISRMPQVRYLPAVVVGCLMWALIYATVGMAVVYAALAVGWQWVALAVVLLVVGTLLWIRYRRRNG